MIKKHYCAAIVTGLFCLSSPLSGSAADDSVIDRFHIGVKAGIQLADGEPANDIPTYSFFGRYRIDKQWLVGFGWDYSSFDFEEPAKILGLDTDKIYDSTISQNVISVWAEREFAAGPDWVIPFVYGGLGIGIGSDDTVTGNLEGGGTFSVYSDAGTEIIPGIGVGVRFPVASHLFLETAVRFDYHFADWEVRDSVSGKTTTVDDYTTYGIYAAVVVSF